MAQNKFINKTSDTLVVIPNWNGAGWIEECLKSLAKQTKDIDIFVVDNGSTDESLDIIRKYTDKYRIHETNLGYTGGVNPGMDLAIDKGYEFVVLFNNDAVADTNMVKHLVASLADSPKTGIATSKILMDDKRVIDSTGDFLSIWGLPYPRGREEVDSGQYDDKTEIFGASGGASCYRVGMLSEIGGMDDDFFAYYEDVDLSARAQWTGWGVIFNPNAVCYHRTSSTSSRMGNFTVRMMIKNLPWLMIKNTPLRYAHQVIPRFGLVYTLLVGRAIARGQLVDTAKGLGQMIWHMPRKLRQRRKIMQSRTVSSSHFWSLLTHDIPPRNNALRKLIKILTPWRILTNRQS